MFVSVAKRLAGSLPDRCKAVLIELAIVQASTITVMIVHNDLHAMYNSENNVQNETWVVFTGGVTVVITRK